MSISSLKNFRGDVVRGSTNCSLSIPIKFKLSCKTKVSYLDLHLVVKKKISELQISVNNLMSMHVLQSTDDLNYITLDF